MAAFFFFVAHLELMNLLLIYVYYLFISSLGRGSGEVFHPPNRAGIILNPLSPPDMDMWLHFLMFSESYLKGSVH